MPAGVNEEIWEKARAAAAKQGHDKDWPYVMGIYKRMTGDSSSDNKSADNKEASAKTGERVLSTRTGVITKKKPDGTFAWKPTTGWKAVADASGPGKGKADGSGLITGMSKQDFINRFMKDVPEDQKNEFLAKYFPNQEVTSVKKKASVLANAILKNARYGTGTINNPEDKLVTDQNPDMTTANRLDNIATRDAGSVADVDEEAEKGKPK